jgi:bifunctional non-homologous end joining protein LigD
VLEIHGWMARADDVEHPDRLVFDLDPDEKLPWKAVVDAAREVRRRLTDAGLESWPMSTGGKGLHVVAPLRRERGWDEAKGFAREIAAAMSADSPGRYLSKASKAERKGKIFVDWLRNGRGASAIVPYSTRARSGAPVATPLRWEEIARFRPGGSTVLTLPRRLAKLADDPWQGFWEVRQALPAPG